MTAQEPSVTVEWNVPARMRDGVVLRADVYRPGGPGPWPTLLTRYPYGKNGTANHYYEGIDPLDAARAGFLVVVQDSRGSYSSDGEWEPWRYERADGYDSVEWAAQLPGSNGRVGMYGQSYHGFTQFAAAIERPPSLKCIAPSMISADGANGLLFRGGALELGFEAVWGVLMALHRLSKLDLPAEELARRYSKVTDTFNAFDDLGTGQRKGRSPFWTLPIRDVQKWYAELGTSAGAGAFRAATEPVLDYLAIATHLKEIEVPVLNTGGWYDTFIQGTLDGYSGLRDRPAETRLVVGPWSHNRYSDPIGDLVFGAQSSREAGALCPQGAWRALHYTWFKQYLVPDSNIEVAAKPVRIFVMGRNEWRDETSWPLERAREERWYLHSGGTLSPQPPTKGASGSTEFDYDPMDPVFTRGGLQILTPSLKTPGPYDQKPVEDRADVVVFTSAPLSNEVEVTGRVRIVLHAQSSAVATDWVARLCDVHPDGRSFNLVDGILRVANAAEPGQVEIDLHSTSNVFGVGHRIRVQVTSSCFPRWDRNLNTGKQHESATLVAHQRIFHDALQPSYIVLPVVS
jgi:uncharacterized protein